MFWSKRLDEYRHDECCHVRARELRSLATNLSKFTTEHILDTRFISVEA